MIAKNISGLPVLDKAHLAGIITTSDILKAFVAILEQDARQREDPQAYYLLN
jgi:CBS domain-containing protein